MQTLKGYKLTADDVTLRDVHILCAGQVGITGSMKGGYIDNFTLRDSIVSGSLDTPGDLAATGEKWGARLYNIRNNLIANTIFRNIEEEHGLYMGRAGNFRVIRSQFLYCGSQGIQDAQREIDSIEGRLANVPCLLEILACRFDHCAMPQGARQSWNLTIFGFDENLRQWYPDGPLILTPQGNPQKGHFVRSLTDVVVAGCEFIGKDYPHLASGNRQCDSTGAILIGDRFNADVTGCKFDFVRPDREVVQFRNVENAYMNDCDFGPGNDIVLHDMDNCHVKIENCRGDGDIRRRALGSHTTTFLSKISAGYSH